MEDLEFIEIDLDAYGSVLPAKNNKIALIDADTVAYTACLAADRAVDVLPKEFYTEQEWDGIINNPSYDSKNGVIYESDLAEAAANAKEKIKRILDRTGCASAELHFTLGRNTFRYTLYPAYKANRTVRAPSNLYNCKKALLESFDGMFHTDWEADDYVVYAVKKDPDKYMLVALDKDVYNSVPGRHFNYYESAAFNKDMKFVEVSENQAKVWPYLQTILGDDSDNVPGCKGIGVATAFKKFISEDMTEQELWKGVVKAWESKGGSSIDAILSMNLVNMNLLQDTDEGLRIVKWMPKDIDESGI